MLTKSIMGERQAKCGSFPLVRSVSYPESASAACALAAGPVAEQVLILENIGTSVQASEDQLPSVYRLLHEAAAMLCMDPPDLYIRQVGEFCALLLGRRGSHAWSCS